MRRSTKRKSVPKDNLTAKAGVEHMPMLKLRQPSVKPRYSMLQARRKRQQTLTQIDFVKRNVSTAEFDLNLIGDKEEGVMVLNTKRRKLEMRSRARSSSPKEATTDGYTGNETPRPETRPSCPYSSVSAPMISKPATDMAPPAPPKTPRNKYIIEIPSSQTPPDSPFSPNAVARLSQLQDSPLSGRISQLSSLSQFKLESIKAPKWRTTLKVESSVSWENEDSQFSPSSLVLDRYKEFDNMLIEEFRHQKSLEVDGGAPEGDRDTASEAAISRSTQSQEPSLTRSYYEAPGPAVKLEIQGSNNEDSQSDYDFGPETQAMVDNLELAPFEEFFEKKPELRYMDSDIEVPQTAVSSTMSQDSFRSASSKLISGISGPEIMFKASTEKENMQQDSQHGFQQDSQEDPLIPDSFQPLTPDLKSPSPPSVNPASQIDWIARDTQGSTGEKRANIRFATISQLLPDSLMFDTLPLPPFSQESFNDVNDDDGT